jgi:membrane associated rhomboid family serine protease
MSVSLSARIKRRIIIKDLNPEKVRAILFRIMEDLNWSMSYFSDDMFIGHTRFSVRSAGEEIRVKLENDMLIFKSECIGIQPLGFGKNISNYRKFLKRFTELNLILNETSQIEIESRIVEWKLDEVNNQQDITQSKENLTDLISIFFSEKDFFFTSKILAINIFIFILMYMLGSFEPEYYMESIYQFGGVHRGLINEGQWWRLISAVFVHGSFLHLFFNMYAFLYPSLILEPLLGRFKFLILYLVLGIIASLSSVAFHLNTISVGASGAIFGLFGVVFSLSIFNIIQKRIRISLIISIAIFTAYNLYPVEGSQIDNPAHLGGFFGGIILGTLLSWHLKMTTFSKKILPLAISFVFLVIYLISVNEYITKYPSFFTPSSSNALFVSHYETNDFGELDDSDDKNFRQKMKLFWRNFDISLKAADFSTYDSQELIMRFEEGIKLLEGNVQLLKELNSTKLTPEARYFLRNAALTCDAYINLYKAYIHALKNPSKNYNKFISPLLNNSLYYYNLLNDSIYDNYN